MSIAQAPEIQFPETRRFTWDDDLLETATAVGRGVISCYPVPFPAVVAGRGSRLETELCLENIDRDQVPVFRRPGGGCAVYVDPGCVIVSLAFSETGFGNIGALFDRCTRWLITGLSENSVTGVYRDGVSDLVIDNFKIGGSCLQRSKNFVYFSAVLPVSCDLDMMDKVLRYPPREPAYRQGRPHNAFVRNLDEFFDYLTVPEVVGFLNRRLDRDVFTP